MVISDLADSLPANKLVSRYCAMRCPDILVAHARCDLHQVHLCTTRAISPLHLLNPLYSLHTQSCFAKVHIAFISALVALLAEGRVKVYYRAPSAENARFADWVLRNTLKRWCQPGLVAEGHVFAERGPGEDAQQQRLDQMIGDIKKVFNGNWRAAQPEHMCYDGAGGGAPCCRSPAETSKKMVQALAPLLEIACNSGHLPRENQWFKLVQSTKPWAAGSAIHNLMPQVFTMALKIKFAPGEDLTEYITDSLQEVNAKRGKKAALSLQEPEFGQKMLLAAIATKPLDTVGHALQTDLRRLSDVGHRLRGGRGRPPQQPAGPQQSAGQPASPPKPPKPSMMAQMVHGDRCVLREAQKKLAELLRMEVSDLAPLLSMECAQSLPVRLVRGVCVELSGEFFARFVLHYDAWPQRWIGFTHSSDEEKDGRTDLVVMRKTEYGLVVSNTGRTTVLVIR